MEIVGYGSGSSWSVARPRCTVDNLQANDGDDEGEKEDREVNVEEEKPCERTRNKSINVLTSSKTIKLNGQ